MQRAPIIGRFGKPTSDSIPTIVRLFKSATTNRVNTAHGTPDIPVWQRNYYKHIICSDDSFHHTREYIATEPSRRNLDRENPNNTGEDEIGDTLFER